MPSHLSLRSRSLSIVSSISLFLSSFLLFLNSFVSLSNSCMFLSFLALPLCSSISIVSAVRVCLLLLSFAFASGMCSVPLFSQSLILLVLLFPCVPSCCVSLLSASISLTFLLCSVLHFSYVVLALFCFVSPLSLILIFAFTG